MTKSQPSRSTHRSADRDRSVGVVGSGRPGSVISPGGGRHADLRGPARRRRRLRPERRPGRPGPRRGGDVPPGPAAAAGARAGGRDPAPAPDLRPDRPGDLDRGRRGRAGHRLGEPAPVRAAAGRGAGPRRAAGPDRDDPGDRRPGHRDRRGDGADPDPGLGADPARGARPRLPAGPPPRPGPPGRVGGAGRARPDARRPSRAPTRCWTCCPPRGRRTSRTCCRTWTRSGGTRSRPRWTTSGWPTCSRSCPRTTR